MEWAGMPRRAPHIDHQQSPDESIQSTHRKKDEPLSKWRWEKLDIWMWKDGTSLQLHKSTQNGFSPYPYNWNWKYYGKNGVGGDL